VLDLLVLGAITVAVPLNISLLLPSLTLALLVELWDTHIIAVTDFFGDQRVALRKQRKTRVQWSVPGIMADMQRRNDQELLCPDLNPRLRTIPT